MKELALTILAFVIVIGALIGALVGLSVAIGNYECQAKTQDIGYDHRWSFWAGCQIQLEDDRWIPLDSYYYQERP